MSDMRRGVVVCALPFIVAAFLHARGVHAHAVVIESSLAGAPVKSAAATEVHLQFNSRIEAKLSRVILLTKGASDRRLTIAAGDKPGELLVQLPSLPAGQYAIRYRVLAADGHITEDVIRFRVAP